VAFSGFDFYFALRLLSQIVMDYLEGGTVRETQRLKNKRLTEAQTAYITKQVCLLLFSVLLLFCCCCFLLLFR